CHFCLPLSRGPRDEQITFESDKSPAVSWQWSCTRASWQWSCTRGTPGRSRFRSRRSNPPGGRTHVQSVSSSLARGLAASRGPGLLVPLRGCRSLRPVGPIWRRRGGLGGLWTIHRLHRPTPVVPAAVPGVARGHPGDSSRSDCRGWTAGRVEAPLVGIRGGGVAAQFRAGDDWCARGEGPDRRLRLDGGRRGISAWGGRAPGTWRRGHPQIRRPGPQTGAVRLGSRDPEGGPLNQRYLQEASGTEVKSSDRGTSSLETINMALEVTVGPPVLTINNGHTFLVSELDGSITPASDQGLYSADTRYLSGYQLFSTFRN